MELTWIEKTILGAIGTLIVLACVCVFLSCKRQSELTGYSKWDCFLVGDKIVIVQPSKARL